MKLLFFHASNCEEWDKMLFLLHTMQLLVSDNGSWKNVQFIIDPFFLKNVAFCSVHQHKDIYNEFFECYWQAKVILCGLLISVDYKNRNNFSITEGCSKIIKHILLLCAE